MNTDLVCWKCGASLKSLPLPLGRLDECPVCRAPLHVCRFCQFFDANTARKCREKDAEEVIDKEKANFCDYFKPPPGPYSQAAVDKAQLARAKLDALFGGEAKPESADDARKKLDELFGGKDRK